MAPPPELAVRQLLTFGGVSLVGTAGHYLLLFLWVEVFHGDAWWGSLAGATLGLLINFALHSRITFAGADAGLIAFTRFVLSGIGGFMTNALVMAAGLGLGLQWLWAQVAATLGASAVNYLLAKFWVFRESTNPAD